MEIKVYGADWCSDCIIVKNFLEEKGIIYEYIVITNNNEAIKFLKKVNNGKKTIPTIEINGEIYSNPGINKLINIID